MIIMKPIFMRVIKDVDRIKSFNKYLLRPLVGGELVKIAADQSPDGDLTEEAFHKRYVRVVLKDEQGAWTRIMVVMKDTLEPLKK